MRPVPVMLGLAGLVLTWWLSDIVLLTFLAIVLACALQPVHGLLTRHGVPRGPAIVAVYVAVLLLVLVAAVAVVPIVVDRVVAFLMELPRHYDAVLAALHESRLRLLRLLGSRLPALDAVPATITGALSMDSLRGVFGLTTGVLAAVSLAVATFALSLYWALDVPRVERLVLSLVPVERRAEALSAWHELEARLGAFVRGQVLVMIAVGVAAAAGYAAIGLPDAIVLGLIAGVCEAIPVVGPLVAAVPAILLALPLGSGTVLAVTAWASLVQLVESHVLMPRVMAHAVGLSALASLLALLVLGSLVGPLGVIAAIPAAVALQVLVERSVLGDGLDVPASEPATLRGLWARARSLRTRLRERLRQRETRMGIDPASPDHRGDELDQRLETAVERIVRRLGAAQATLRAAPSAEAARILHELDAAVREIELATAPLDAATEPSPRHAERVHAAVEHAAAVLRRLDDGASTA
ncbi:MAG: AI-2E family transporter [bacterium]|nr:AI-2E family transporter [bacterium]